MRRRRALLVGALTALLLAVGGTAANAETADAGDPYLCVDIAGNWYCVNDPIIR